MTIIFANRGDIDCEIMQMLWQGLPDAKVITVTTDPKKEWEYVVSKAIEAEEDMLIFAGHGTGYGLMHPSFNGDYIFCDEFIPDVKAKNVVCLWCHASDFCTQNNFPSFSSSMFITNYNEAINNAIYGVGQDAINKTNKRFWSELRHLIMSRVPLSEWVMRLGAHMDVEDPIDTFNRQGLMYIGNNDGQESNG